MTNCRENTLDGLQRDLNNAVCKFSVVDQLGEAKRGQSLLAAEQHRHRMTGHLSEPPTHGMPPVHGPYFLGVEAADKLTDYRFDPSAHASQIRRKRRVLMGFGLKRRQQRDIVPLQRLGQVRTPVITIGQCPPSGPGEHLRGHFDVADACRSKFGTADDPRPRDGHVSSQPVEGLPSQFVVAVGRLGRQSLAPGRASKSAHRNGKAVRDRHQRVAIDLSLEVRLQVFFDLPEVGGLPPEGRAMDLQELGKQCGVMAAKVGKNALVCVVFEEFADNLAGKDHAVTRGRTWAASAQSLAVEEVDQKVVDNAEHRDDKVVKRHGRQVVVGPDPMGCT